MFKKVFSAASITLLLLAVAVGCTAQEAEVKLDSTKNRISYTIGLNIGQDFVKQEMDIDPELLLVGVRDAMAGKEPRMTEEEMMAEVQAFQTAMKAKQEARMQQLNEKNLKEGEAFLAENAKQEGVVVLPSGLQYKVIEAGKGEKPTADSMVSVHYRGTLVDGTEFDSSYKRNEPATFPVGGVIPGWVEALQLMPEGSKWQLFIPAKLAYGERGAGRDIGPNSTLIFDVELIKIIKDKE